MTSLKITILPDNSSGDRLTKIESLKQYLTTELNIPVQIAIAPDYDSAVTQLVAGSVDMAYLGPLTYIEAKEKNPTLEPLVAPIDQNSGRPWYTSIIVGTANIKTLEEIKGKRFGFVNESSTSGFLVPNHQFKLMGIDPQADFAAVLYGEAHDKNLQLLLDGKVEAIAIDQATYLTALKSGKLDPNKYHLIWESAPITNPPIVISGNVPTPIKLQIKKALVNAPPGLVSISVSDAAGYTIIEDADYQLIRDLYKAQQDN